LNKWRAGKLVPKSTGRRREPPASLQAEAAARAVNAEPWEPLAGMVKRQCEGCRYFFAAPADSEAPRCPDYVTFGAGRAVTPESETAGHVRD